MFKKMIITLVVICVLVVVYNVCSHNMPILKGKVVVKHFSNSEDSYVDIITSESGRVRLIFDTEERTYIIKIVIAVEDFEGRAEELDKMIDIGDTLKVNTRKSKGYRRDVLNILAIHKSDQEAKKLRKKASPSWNYRYSKQQRNFCLRGLSKEKRMKKNNIWKMYRALRKIVPSDCLKALFWELIFDPDAIRKRYQDEVTFKVVMSKKWKE